MFPGRKPGEPVRRLGWFTNRWLIVGIAVQLLAQLALTYVPIMNTLFQTAPLSAEAWLRVVAAAVLVWVVVTLDKSLRHRREGRSVSHGRSPD